MRRVGFLFNHDAPHQVSHSAPIAFGLSRKHPDIEVSIFTTSADEQGALDDIGAHYAGSNCRVQKLAVPRSVRLLDWLCGGALPIKRVGTLWRHRALFRSLDALVVPEKTSLRLKRWLGKDCPKLIHTRHGAGDRAVGFNSESAQFDFHLIPGRKHEARMKALGQLSDGHYAIVGYTKFDLIAQKPRPQLFENGRPTVIYAPHFDPMHSSWYRWGAEVLEFFAGSGAYNLIFAPHVMLFRRRMQISTDGIVVRRPPPVPNAAMHAGNIKIDTDSPALADMTYLRAADIYLGDVSSQVYEFLYEPRPCIFLNSAGADWAGSDNYRFWNAGPVLNALDALPAALEESRNEHARYRVAQKELFAETFDLTDRPSAERAADAIADFIR